MAGDEETTPTEPPHPTHRPGDGATSRPEAAPTRERREADPLDARWSPPWLLRAASVGGRLLVLAVLVWLLAELATSLTLLLVAIAVALLLAGVLAPGVDWAGRHRVPRGVAAGAGVGLVVLVVVGVGLTIGTQVADQLPELREQVGSVAQQASDTLGVEIPGVGQGSGSDGSGGSGSSGVSGGMLDQLSSALGVAVDVVIGLFLALAFLFLLLKNGPSMWASGLRLLDGQLREDVDVAGRAAWGTVGAYVRGLTVVAAIDAVGIGVGLLLLGVPLALTLALLQFVASYIPTIGAFVAGALAVVVAWTSGGLGTAVAVTVLVVAVQQVGNDVVEPWVMERELPLNAFAVLAAVTAGGLLWGIAGALLFVPLTAALMGGARALWDHRGRPPLLGRRQA